MTRHGLAVLSWKIGCVGLAALLVVLSLSAAVHWQRSLDPALAGTLDSSLRPEPGSRRHVVTALGPRSPLASFGVKVGDELEFNRSGDKQRTYGIDESIGITWLSGGRAQHIVVRPVAKGSIDSADRIAYFSAAATAVLALVIGSLIGLRRAESPAMRWLALHLLSISGVFAAYYLPGGDMRDFVTRAYNAWAFAPYYVCFAMFALRFPEERELWRHRAVRAGARLYLFVWMAWLSITLAVRFGGWSLQPGVLTVLNAWGEGLAVTSVAIGLGALLFNWQRSRGATRDRLRWITLCLGGGQVLGFLSNLPGSLGLAVAWAEKVLPIVLFLSYCGLGYAILRHRVLDFGFAVNRALVYSIVSFVLLAAFFGIKSVAETLLRLEGPNSSALLNGGIALAIFVVFHRVHDFIEHQVKRWLFRKWHLNEQALRQFLKRAAHITRTDSLLTALSGALDRFTSQGGNAIYRIMGDGGFLREHGTLANAPQQVDADDPLVVAMKAELGPVECGATGSALPAVLGLPMTHRGELDGFVLIGSKPKQEVFRPDEVELLGHAAQQVGLDLNALQVVKLKRELAALSGEKRSFSELEREMRTMVERALLAKDVPAG